MVCKECYCGGLYHVPKPQGHSRMHSRLTGHPLFVLLDDPNFCWCFCCLRLIPTDVLAAANDETESTMSDTTVYTDDDDVENQEGFIKEEELIEDGHDMNPNSALGFFVMGLNNPLNNCFFNAIIQNLLALRKLREYMMSLDKPAKRISAELWNLFVITNSPRTSDDVTTLSGLFDAISEVFPDFMAHIQQNSYEFFALLLSQLELEEKRNCMSSSNEQDTEATRTNTLFQSELQKLITCSRCGDCSIVSETFQHLSLPIHQELPKVPRGDSEEKISIVGGYHCPDVQESSLDLDQGSTLRGHVTTPLALVKSDFVHQKCEISNAQRSYGALISQNENDIEVMSNWKVSHWLETSDVRDCNVQQLSDKEDLNVKGFDSAGIFMTSYNDKVTDQMLKGLIQQHSLDVDYGGQADDLISALLDETHGNLEVQRDSGRHEHTGMPLLGGNADDLYQGKDVDTLPCVSLESCLTLFTTYQQISDRRCGKCLGNLPNCSVAEPKNHKKITSRELHEKALLAIADDASLQHETLHRWINSLHLNSAKNVLSTEQGMFSLSQISADHNEADAINDDNQVGHDGAKLDSIPFTESFGTKMELNNGSTKKDTGRYLISKAPRILVLHLMRFSRHPEESFSSKIKNHVTFPEILDLSPYMIDSVGKNQCSYQLTGVVQHTGNLNSGHYVAYIRANGHGNRAGKKFKWYLANDDRVCEVSLSHVLRSQAYLLFYEACQSESLPTNVKET